MNDFFYGKECDEDEAEEINVESFEVSDRSWGGDSRKTLLRTSWTRFRTTEVCM